MRNIFGMFRLGRNTFSLIDTLDGDDFEDGSIPPASTKSSMTMLALS